MKKKRYSQVFVMVLLIVSVMTTGCIGQQNSSAESKSEIYQDSDWKNTEMLQANGKKLSIELPFKIQKHEKFEPDTNLKEQERYTYTDNRMLVSIYHGVLADPNIEVDFTMDTFLGDIHNPINPKMEKNVKRTINGRKMTYAKFRIGEEQEPYTVECLGMNVDNEFWTILFSYREDDVSMQKLVEKSIESVSVR